MVTHYSDLAFCIISNAVHLMFMVLDGPVQHLAWFFASLHSLDSVPEDKMLARGITAFCNDLGVDPASLNVLVIAWVFKAATQCEFTRGEFVQGMTDLA